jgi:hypothetical protein
MITIEYNYKDKSEWGEGEWQQEEDKIQWEDKKTNLPCLIVRGPHGGLCGYVGVYKDHPFYELQYCGSNEYTASPADLLDVHGGITWSDFCRKDKHSICHIVEEGEDDNVWWLGFDCAHSGDLTPYLNKSEYYRQYPREGIYRNISYVTKEVERLAYQLKNIKEIGTVEYERRKYHEC